MTLVDIHCHILPGIDDGSKDWETSIKLARDAVKDGITHAVCTPHTLNGKYINHKKDVIRLTENFQDMLDEAKIPLTVFPGQEVRISGDLPEALDNDDILFLDEDGQYMLLEFPSDDVPTYAKDMIFDCSGVLKNLEHQYESLVFVDRETLINVNTVKSFDYRNGIVYFDEAKEIKHKVAIRRKRKLQQLLQK